MSSPYAKTATKLGQMLYTKTSDNGSSETVQTTDTSTPCKNGSKHFNAMPVMIRGVLYQSHKEAAEALGVSTSAISQRLRVRGDAETVGLGLKGASIGNNNGSKEIEIWDMKFPSRTKAAELLGITRSQLTKWTSPKASKWQQNQLLIHALRYKRERDKKRAAEATQLGR